MKRTYNPTAAPVKVYGPAVLTLPVGFLVAQNQGQQVAALTRAYRDTNPAKLNRMLTKLFGL